jgi:hypothetical protein
VQRADTNIDRGKAVNYFVDATMFRLLLKARARVRQSSITLPAQVMTDVMSIDSSPYQLDIVAKAEPHPATDEIFALRFCTVTTVALRNPYS